MGRIQMLRDEIATCTKINDKISSAFFKALEIVKDLEGPPLIRYSIVITKEQLDMKLGVIKSSWVIQFNDLTEFPEDEIKWCFYTFVNKNEDHLELVEQLHSK
jgi:hypothetical protein